MRSPPIYDTEGSLAMLDAIMAVWPRLSPSLQMRIAGSAIAAMTPVAPPDVHPTSEWRPGSQG